jgi:hypothetical protein
MQLVSLNIKYMMLDVNWILVALNEVSGFRLEFNGH